MVVGLAGNAFAIDWDNESGDNLWRTPLNWEGNVLPTSADNARIILTDPNHCLIDSATVADANKLSVGHEGGAGDLRMTGGSLVLSLDHFTVGHKDYAGTFVLEGGTVTVSEKDMRVGRSVVGTFTMEGGLVDVNDDLIIADNTGSGGSSMTLSGGTVAVDDMTVGDDANGTFTMSNGTLTIGDDLYIADDVNSGGSSMTLTGGTVTAGGTFRVGDDAKGTFTIEGGSLSPGYSDVRIADACDSGGSTIKIKGGTVIFGKKLHVGRTKPGHLEISSGSLTVAGDMAIADRDGSTGSTMTMTSGTVTANEKLKVGEDDYGTLNMSGGTLTIGNDLEIADDSGSSGSTMTLSGGTVTVGDDFIVGDQEDGTFTMSDGSITIADDLIIADETSGGGSSMTLTGGTVTVNNDFEVQNSGHVQLDGGIIVVVNNNDFVLESTSSMDITGGTLVLSGDEVSTVYGFVGDGRITAYGGNPRAVKVEYDSGTDKTTVTADMSCLALAWNPNPENGATVQWTATGPTLSWSPGDYVAGPPKHKVFFSEKFDDVNEGIGGTEQDANSYGPVAVEFGKRYYWRVDEANSITGWDIGNVWRFTVANYLIVDDFESYNLIDNLIYNTWEDGYVNGTGAIVYLETSIVQGGAQAMLLNYYNYYGCSETDRTYVEDQNWTAVGVKALRLRYRGVASNTVGEDDILYVVLKDAAGKSAVVTYGEPNDLKEESWQSCDIALQDFVDANNVNLAKIRKVTIGIGERGAVSGVGYGNVYIDNIRLYRPRCLPSMLQPLAADLDNDCDVDYDDVDIMGGDWLDSDYEILASPPAVDPVAHYEFNGNFDDSSTNAINGTSYGATISYDSVLGSNVAVFDSSKLDYVDLGNPTDPCLLDFGTGNWSVCAWVKTTMSGGSGDTAKGVIYGKGGDTSGGHRYGLYVNEDTDDGHLTLVTDDDVTKYTPDSDAIISDGAWHHVVGMRDGTELRMYVDGIPDGDTETISPSYDLSGTHQYNAYLGAITDYDDTSPTLFKFFVGSMDDVRIYDYALSHAEVVSVMGLSGLYVPLDTPAELYDDEAEGDRIINFKDYAVIADKWLVENLWP